MKIPKYALPHRVTIIPLRGQGPYGPIYDGLKTKRNVPALIEPRTTVLIGPNGEDIQIRAEAMFHPDYKIRVGDKIQWPETGAEYTVREFTPVYAMGLSHYEGVLI